MTSLAYQQLVQQRSHISQRLAYAVSVGFLCRMMTTTALNDWLPWPLNRSPYLCGELTQNSRQCRNGTDP